MIHRGVLLAGFLVLPVLSGGAVAFANTDENPCIKVYERAAAPYWRIASDMLTFQSMFDDYDRLCTKHFPDAMDSLQPGADQLRAQVKTDIENAAKSVQYIFANTLPNSVEKHCSDDEKSRKIVEKNFLAQMDEQSSRVAARLKRSAKSVTNPDESLKLCRDLGQHAPKIQKILGPDLSNPLLEMTALHAQATRTNARPHRNALKIWRDALKNIDSKSSPAE